MCLFTPAKNEGKTYNSLFMIEELSKVISRTKDNFPEPENISNMLLKAIPTSALPYVLNVLNQLWYTATMITDGEKQL